MSFSGEQTLVRFLRQESHALMPLRREQATIINTIAVAAASTTTKTTTRAAVASKSGNIAATNF